MEKRENWVRYLSSQKRNSYIFTYKYYIYIHTHILVPLGLTKCLYWVPLGLSVFTECDCKEKSPLISWKRQWLADHIHTCTQCLPRQTAG